MGNILTDVIVNGAMYVLGPGAILNGWQAVVLGNLSALTVADSNFNSGAFGSGWSIAGGSPAFAASNQYPGSAYSLSIAASQSIVSDYITCSEGYQFALDMWLIDLASRPISFQIEYFDVSSVSLGTKSFQIVLLGDSFSKRIVYLFSGVSPTGTTKCKITITGSSGFGSNTVALQKIDLRYGYAMMFRNSTITGPLTFADAITFSSTIVASNLSGTNTGDVTLAGAPNYLTIAGQVITRALINLTSHVTGVLPVANGGTNVSAPTGTYTPTITNTTNVAASTARVTNWFRMDDMVHVFGNLDADPTAAGACVIGLSLPIASNLANVFELGGGGGFGGAGAGVRIIGDISNDRATLEWTAPDGTNRPMSFAFSYKKI